MATIIPIHYSSMDINQIKLKIESKTWISRLEFIQSEMEFYSFLMLSEKLEKRLTSNSSEIVNQISLLKKENKNLTTKMIEYRNHLEGMKECEDLQCDAFYLNDYEELRIKIEKHIANIHALKLTVFRELKIALK